MTAGQWRYIAQRMRGDGSLGDFLDFDVPLMQAAPEEVLSGDNGLTGLISPEYMRLKGPDGRPILEEWGSALWAESPDGNIWGGILTHSSFDGPNWSVECTDLSGMLDGLPYTEANNWVNVDPLDVFREIWRYAQAQRGGNLGISIDPLHSPIRLGTDLVQRDITPGEGFDLEEDPSAGLDESTEPVYVSPSRYDTNKDWREAGVKVMKRVNWDPDTVDAALRKWLNKDQLIEDKKWEPLTNKERTIKNKVLEKIGPPPNPPTVGGTLVENMRPNTNYVPATEESTTEEGETEPVLVLEYDAYKLNWYTNHDLSSDVSNLAQATPFDWHLIHYWQDEEIRHHIRLGYPKIGRRLVDERFVIGENIHVIPSVERDGTEYANEVLVLGAGEGSSMIMGRAFRDDGRVRRVAVVSDPSITTLTWAIARAEEELKWRINLENIAEIVLLNHPHAPIGSVSLGDEILVEGETGWVDLEVWCRVVGRRLDPDNSDAVTLTLVRSDRLA